MDSLKSILENYDKPLTKEQLEKIIYNIFFIAIFLAPAIPEIIGFGIYSLRNTIFIFTTIITSLSLVIINRKNIKTNTYDKILIIYMIFVILSTIFTDYGIVKCIFGSNGRGEGLITIFSYVATLIIFSRGYDKIKSVSKLAIVAAMVVCAYSFIQANRPEGIKILFAPNTAKGVAAGTMRNPNFLSSYICMFLPAACFYYINIKTKLKTLISLVVTVILFITQIYSVTLGGYITFGIMLVIIVIYSLLFSKNIKQTILKTIVLGLVLTSTFYIINYEGEQKYQKEISISKQEVTNLVEKKDSFGSGRLGIWKKCLMLIQDYPVFGVGPDSMSKASSKEKYITNGKNDVLSKYIVDKSHCEPLHIAVTTGVPSAIVYVILVGIIGIRLLLLSIKKTKEEGIEKDNSLYITMVLICFSSYLMQSLINISVVQVAPLFWAIAGTAVGILEFERK